MSDQPETQYDLFVIGGGINGCGIARDAAGRGFSVGLAEMNDFASATSSASTKLFHGGLRYLEFFEFRLVKEALKEREVLLRNMPHISWPMRFVLPYHRDMRFPGGTPTSKLLGIVMPWMKDRRPAWLIRLGLFMYDTLGGRSILPGTSTVDLQTDPAGRVLQEKFAKAYEYSDCWVDDARLVVLNARDAAARGADIMPRTKVLAADPEDGGWTIRLGSDSGERKVRAKMVVNAGGPWAGDILGEVFRKNQEHTVRLVRGSHIVTRRLFDHDKCYFFQGTDGRIIFAIPYEKDFTLIGTTDQEHEDPSTPPVCTDAETDYLLSFASNYFATPISRADIVWTYSGVRPLYDDGASSATAATRDYVLSVDTSAGAPVLSVFGGKITTYRRLAEAALSHINTQLSKDTAPWTAQAALPGGDFAVDGKDKLVQDLIGAYDFLDPDWANRLARTYGTQAHDLLHGATSLGDLGESFGATITARELDWSMTREWSRTAQDFLWRRTKLGLHLSAEESARVDAYMQSRLPQAAQV